MKKVLALVLASIIMLCACALADVSVDTTAAELELKGDPSSIKIGAILIGDENEGYSYAHILGIQNAAKALGIAPEQIIFKYNVPEDAKCFDAAADLADAGCNIVISNSYAHQPYTQQAAEEFPEIQFVAMTGDTANKAELPNFANAFTKVFESRFVSGVVAGMKIAELNEAGKLSAENFDEDGKVKVGYVGAYPYAEVVSGYTAFFLGIRSVFENVSMDVTYTNSWFDITAEAEAANSLVADGCVIIGQHADSTGAPSAVQSNLEAGKLCYSIGYNVDMLSVAPQAALTSATNNWEVYYEYAFKTVINGENLARNWSAGYAQNAVQITALGESVAPGTEEKVNETIAALQNGDVKVFDINTFTVGGETVNNAFATDTDGDFAPDADEAIIDGEFVESYFMSAPAFGLRIDGITELN